MSNEPIKGPFEVFTDIDGTPLENGKIYIGTKDLDAKTNQIAVYWDADLTSAASQPISTKGGYPSNNGTAANLYVGNIDYSITVENRNNSAVFSVTSARNLDTTSVSVKSFGAKGDGVTDDTDAIQAALNAVTSGQTVTFEDSKTYLTSKPLWMLRTVDWSTAGYTTTDRENVTIEFNNAELKLATTVDWEFDWQNYPSFERDVNTSYNQAMRMFIVSLDNVTIRNGNFNANMQARAVANGNPGAREQEHCLVLIGCNQAYVDNITTKDSMGDGIYLGYAYTVSGSGTSAYKNSDNAAGNNQYVSVNNTKSFRHSRNGISFVGAKYCQANNIYGEQLDSVANFVSGAGPGATVDLEYDSSQNVYDANGSSDCRENVITNVIGRENSYGGAFQAINARECTVRGVTSIGGVTISCVRTGAGAKRVDIHDITIRGTSQASAVGNGFDMGGEDIVIDGVTVDNCTVTKLFQTGNTSTRLQLNDINVAKSTIFSDNTQYIFSLANVSEITLRDVDIEVAATSSLRGIFYSSSTNSRFFVDGFRLKAEDGVALYNNSRGVFHFEGTGIVGDVVNMSIEAKIFSLFSTASSFEANTLLVNGFKAKGAVSFPSKTHIGRLICSDCEIESAYNTGSGTDAALFLQVEDGIDYTFQNLRIASTAQYGYNKTKEFIYIATTEASFATVTNTKIRFNDVVFTGGRDTDGLMTSVAFANGVGVTEPWTDATSLALFSANNVNMNSHKGTEITCTSGAASYEVGNGGGISVNMTFLPGQYVDLIPFDSFQDNYFINRYQNLAGANNNSFKITFDAGALGSNQKFIITE